MSLLWVAGGCLPATCVLCLSPGQLCMPAAQSGEWCSPSRHMENVSVAANLVPMQKAPHAGFVSCGDIRAAPVICKRVCCSPCACGNEQALTGLACVTVWPQQDQLWAPQPLL